MAVDWGLLSAFISSVKLSLDLGKLILIKNKKIEDALKQKDILEEIRRKENNGNIFLIQGDGNSIYLGDLGKLPSGQKSNLLENYSYNKEDGGSQKEINIIDHDFYPRVERFERSEHSDRKIDKISAFLEPDLRNILKLSIYVKELYDEGNHQEAAVVKSDIGYQYGKNGRKLCNLHSNGYIIALIDFLYAYHDGNEKKIKEDVNERILSLIGRPIFYIHPGDYKRFIIEQIYRAFHRKEIYIAVHAAGQNISKAEEIILEVTERAKSCGYDIAVSQEKTLSQTPIYNVYITFKE